MYKAECMVILIYIQCIHFVKVFIQNCYTNIQLTGKKEETQHNSNFMSSHFNKMPVVQLEEAPHLSVPQKIVFLSLGWFSDLSFPFNKPLEVFSYFACPSAFTFSPACDSYLFSHNQILVHSINEKFMNFFKQKCPFLNFHIQKKLLWEMALNEWQKINNFYICYYI